MRRQSRKIYYGSVGVGGDAPITIQSMTNTDTRNIKETTNQINRLTEEGCEIIRVAVLDIEAAKAIKAIKREITIPIIADIHFDYRLALESIKSGIDGLRINPGNIGSKEKVREIVLACKEHNIPIRIGVNSGSVKEEYLEKYNGVNEESITQSALEHVKILEDMDFLDIVISLKASDVRLTYNSYMKMAQLVDYPFHIGITEAGTISNGIIKSAIGIGSLLLSGIGDTIRVSLTEDPKEEIKVGKQILKNLGFRKDGIEIISCPTCGRTQIDLINVVKEAEKRLEKVKKPIKVAIMGCAVNGPGEAKEADLGIAGGKGEGLIFKKGQIVKKVKETELLGELMREIEKL